MNFNPCPNACSYVRLMIKPLFFQCFTRCIVAYDKRTDHSALIVKQCAGILPLAGCVESLASCQVFFPNGHPPREGVRIVTIVPKDEELHRFSFLAKSFLHSLGCVNGRCIEQQCVRVVLRHQQAEFGTPKDHCLRATTRQSIDDAQVLSL